MTLWLQTFAHDTKVHIALVLVVVDIVLGIAAALKLKAFTLSYVADFARNDFLYKLIPYYVIYVLALVAGGTDIVPTVDFGILAGAFYAFIVAAWVGSILASLAVLGFKPAQMLGDAFTRKEQATPPS